MQSREAWIPRAAAALVLAICLVPPQKVGGQDIPESLVEDQCVVCHTDFGVLPENYLPDAVHMQPGLSCSGCHGGDATSDDEEIAHSGSFAGVPTRQAVPEFCGKCHSDLSYMRQFNPSASTDQVTQYYTSVHGQKLLTGDQNVAECASCHTAHAILDARDARSSVHPLNVPAMCNTCHGDAELMGQYQLRSNQYSRYVQSVHGKALLERQDTGAPACNDCHGNHGAQSPGIASIEHVCGMCHVNNADYFGETAMARSFREDELHACEECHRIHLVEKTSDEMVGVGDESVCTTCHEEGDEGYRVAEEMHGQLMTLVSTRDSARVLLEEVERVGMDDVEIAFLLREAQQSLIQTRTLVHTFDPARTGEMASEGIQKASEALTMARVELEGYRFRRFGFGVATLLITLLTVALFLKIREIESRKAP